MFYSILFVSLVRSKSLNAFLPELFMLLAQTLITT